MKSVIAFAAAVVAVAAAPAPVPVAIEERQAFENQPVSAWDAGATKEFRIHSSCNASQAYQIRGGLAETVQLAQHAKDHVLRWYNESDIYQKYFGKAHYTEVVGAYDLVIHGDRAHALFRCDDPDRNCANFPTWGGHWRGNNATEETVICPTSFYQRRYLATLCAQGYNVRQSSRLIYWASDLLHRLYHVPAFGQEYIDHYAEGYEAIIAAARNGSQNSVRDSDGLQYFALEAYAHDIILPGVGCPGPAGPPSLTTSSTAPASTSTAAATLTSTTPAAAASTTSRAVSTTAAAAGASASASSSALPSNCHSHADGSVHCV